MNGRGPDLDDSKESLDAARGLVARLEPGEIKDARGDVVWDANAFSFLEGECPPTANPRLWRHARLCARQGLFEVTEGIYQIRGLDISNMTLIEGATGVLVVDPLVAAETASAGLELYREHRGDLPVTGVVYTHSHVDHFGGVGGVTRGGVPILAPKGFMEHAAAENVYAGSAMRRRGIFQSGTLLPADPAGQVGLGIGPDVSKGTVTLIAPNREIARTGQEEVVDGVRFVFQMTSGAEAPTEMNFYLPDRRALCMADNSLHTMHEILPLRGAPVRDARVWSRYLDEALALFAHRSDVLFVSHTWPTWGTDELSTFLSEQRDMYAYLHDQTLRLLNQGLVGSEIAEQLELAPSLRRRWHTQGYHGSISHNVKAVYQRYMGWFDGNPAHLWEHPPEEQAQRYVECMGGVDEVVRKAEAYRDEGDLRFAATLLDHAVFAEPGHRQARQTLADVYERLGHGAENGNWRNFYLQGAVELRDAAPTPAQGFGMGMTSALRVDQLFDAVAVRVNGPEAWDEYFTIDWIFNDLDATYRTTLSHGALTTRAHPRSGEADLRVTLNKFRLLRLLAGKGTDGMEFDGDAALVDRLFGLLDEVDQNFDIVLP